MLNRATKNQQSKARGKKRSPAERANRKPTARVARAGALKQRQEQRKKTGQKRGPGKPFSKRNKWAFQPGQSGNPNGRPKSITVSDALRRALKEVNSDGRTIAEVICDQLLHLAIKGRGHIKIRAIQEIVDRVEGKPRQSVEVLVPKSEIDRYESLIEQYLQAAKDQGIDLTRDQAISYLAEADNRILTVLGVASEYAQ